MALSSLFKKAILFPFILIASYAIFVLLLCHPWIQKQALYAHNVHSGRFHNLSNPSSFGFATNQVLPLNVSTPDNETLYAWHILPLQTYVAHETTLLSSPTTSLPDIFTDLIRTDPLAKIVINFHGNAGHVAQGWRTDTYLRLSTLPHVHVFSVDYRGFGRSTGSPSEKGLITDGITFVQHVMRISGVPSDRVVILGQSLGTAVASAVGLWFADGQSEHLPAGLLGAGANGDTVLGGRKEPVFFASIILVAPFTSLPQLLRTYRIFGLVPILAPLAPYPVIQNLLDGFIVDKWPTLVRLKAYVAVLRRQSARLDVGKAEEVASGRLQVIHAVDDRDIWVGQSFEIAEKVLGKTVQMGQRLETDIGGKPRVGVEILEFGGHNRVVTWAPVAAAVIRGFGGLD